MKFLERLCHKEKRKDTYLFSSTTTAMIPKTPESFHLSPLYVILPYFNYCGFEKRRKLFIDFVGRYARTPNVKLVVVEATQKGTRFQLPAFTNVILHIKVELSDRVWIKENLINIGVKHLPPDWYYVAWIDADITFLNPSWAIHTIQRLKTKDIVQLFQTSVHLGPDEEAFKIDKSFIYMYLKSGQPYHKTAKYGFWHPGYAWACNKHAYQQMGGLLDFGILGSGDRHMALAFIGKGEWSYHGSISEEYKNKIAEFQKKCVGFKLDYVPGTILHHFHGSLADRKYVDRWNILITHNYNPCLDIFYEANGLLKLTETGKKLQKDMDTYFLERKEDGGVV